ncbi:MAG: ATP-binding protein [Lachnospiraceae bacterium]
MIENDKRVRIITGYYGSGKTEFAVNYVKKLAELVKKPAIADLDIVNVYFRSREKAEELIKMNIEVMSSSVAEDNCDMPALSSRINVPFIDKAYDYVIDLGGSEVGANILGRYKDDIDAREIDFLMVINLYRPETGNVGEIMTQIQHLEESSGYKITGLVNNSNLIHETKLEHIIEGDQFLREVSAKTGIPVRYTTCMMGEGIVEEELSGRVQGEVFPMHYNMRKIWM